MENVHEPWPLLYGPLLLRRKAASTCRCPKVGTDPTDMTANISCLVFTKTAKMKCFQTALCIQNIQAFIMHCQKCPKPPTHTMHSKVCTWLYKCMRADHVVICTAFKIAFLGTTMPFAKKSLLPKLHSYFCCETCSLCIVQR